MDREKLNAAAEKAATIQYRNLSDPDVSQDGRTEAMFASMFEQGANWLMQQPLSDRLTDEEKEKIKALYYEYHSHVFHIELEKIFGKELFNTK